MTFENAEWIRYTIDIPQITKELVIALVSASDISQLLGNTASVVDRRWNSMATDSLHDRHVTPEVKKIRNTKKLYKIVSLRHPDPSLRAILKVEHPELQVLESLGKSIGKEKGRDESSTSICKFHWEQYVDSTASLSSVNIFPIFTIY